MNSVDVSNDSKIMHYNEIYWMQLRYHREREYKIFIWTSAILLSLLAGLTTGKIPPDFLGNMIGKLFASTLITIWSVIAISLQKNERNYGNQYTPVLADIAKELGMIKEENKGLLPTEWGSWGKKGNMKLSYHLVTGYVPITVFLGAVSVLLIWL